MKSGRYDMYNDNKFKIGLFGANCSSGRAIVKNIPDRWRADWDSCSEMARLADEGGFDFILPIGRWKGYGGESNFQGSTYETITWATGLLAQTKRITILGTVHAPIFNPLVAAKMMVTAPCGPWPLRPQHRGWLERAGVPDDGPPATRT